MKYKIVLLFLLLLVVTGCSNVKTCSIEKDNGSSITYKMKADEDVVKSFKMTYVMTTEALQISSKYSSMKEIDKENLEIIKDNYIKELGLDDNKYKGIKIDIKFTDDMIVTIEVDIEEADKDILNKLGFDFSDDENISLDMSINGFIKEGYTCK